MARMPATRRAEKETMPALRISPVEVEVGEVEIGLRLRLRWGTAREKAITVYMKGHIMTITCTAPRRIEKGPASHHQGRHSFWHGASAVQPRRPQRQGG